MLRLSEIGLFLVPFGLYVAWRILGPRLPPPAVWAALLLTGLLAAVTVWLGLTEGLDTTEIYQPARIENGVVVRGHGITPAP